MPDKILIVDDDPGIRDTLSDLIQELGYQTCTAQDGLAAISLLNAGPFLCVFTDIMMPNMSGIELIQKIKSRDISLPIIVITGYASLKIAVDAMKNGASDFLPKPFTVKQIELLLSKMQREKQLLEENKRYSDELQLRRLIDTLVGQLEDKAQEISSLQDMSERITSLKGIRDLVGAIEDVAGDMITDAQVCFYPLNRKSWKLIDPVAGTERTPDDELEHGCIARKEVPGVLDCGNYETVFPLMIEDQLFAALSIVSSKMLTTDEERKIAYFLQRAAERMENVALYEGLYENILSTLNSMAKIIDARDPYTSQHSTRVTMLATSLARALKISVDDLDILSIAASLHDIGKVGIPDHILLKPDRLTDEEFTVIKRHADIGADILNPIIPMRKESQIIRHHHERYDGKGYPLGLAGEDIPLLSRIITLADAYDAMTSDRPYRKGLAKEAALAEITRCRGTQFDPVIAGIFIETLGED